MFLKYALANLALGLVNLAKNATAALAKFVLRLRYGAVPTSNGVMLFLRVPQHRVNTTTLVPLPLEEYHLLHIISFPVGNLPSPMFDLWQVPRDFCSETDTFPKGKRMGSFAGTVVPR